MYYGTALLLYPDPERVDMWIAETSGVIWWCSSYTQKPYNLLLWAKTRDPFSEKNIHKTQSKREEISWLATSSPFAFYCLTGFEPPLRSLRSKRNWCKISCAVRPAASGSSLNCWVFSILNPFNLCQLVWAFLHVFTNVRMRIIVMDWHNGWVWAMD